MQEKFKSIEDIYFLETVYILDKNLVSTGYVATLVNFEIFVFAQLWFILSREKANHQNNEKYNEFITGKIMKNWHTISEILQKAETYNIGTHRNKQNSIFGDILSWILDVNNVLYQKIYYVISTWNKFYNTL